MARSFQERIKGLSEYNPSIEYKDGNFILRIQFKPAWKIVPIQDTETVAYGPDSRVPGLHIFVSKIDDTDAVFDIIEDSININKELERKILFYNQKVAELEELILSDIPYEKLIKLQFVIPEPKVKKVASKQVKKSKTPIDELPIEEPNTVQNEDVVETHEISDIDKAISEALG